MQQRRSGTVLYPLIQQMNVYLSEIQANIMPHVALRSRPLHLHVVKPGNPSSMEPSQRRNGKHAEHCYDNQRCLSSTRTQKQSMAFQQAYDSREKPVTKALLHPPDDRSDA